MPKNRNRHRRGQRAGRKPEQSRHVHTCCRCGRLKHSMVYQAGTLLLICLDCKLGRSGGQHDRVFG